MPGEKLHAPPQESILVCYAHGPPGETAVSLKRVIIVGCLCATSCTFPDAPRTGPSAPQPVTSARRPPSDEGMYVPINALFEAFEQNALEANEKYKDKTLLLRDCTIRSVDPFSDPPFIELYVGLAGAYVRCWFEPKDKDLLGQRKPGGNITLKGRCVGAVNNFVTLDGCTEVRYRDSR
jgi:hypothetical protein